MFFLFSRLERISQISIEFQDVQLNNLFFTKEAKGIDKMQRGFVTGETTEAGSETQALLAHDFLFGDSGKNQQYEVTQRCEFQPPSDAESEKQVKDEFFTKNIVTLPQRSFDEIWASLFESLELIPINDFVHDKEKKEISGTYWGTGEATGFTLNVYNKKGVFKLDFQRSSGNTFDFHRVRDEVLHILLQRPRSRSLNRNMTDPETGENLGELMVNENDLNDWSRTLSDCDLKVRQHLTSVLAQAASQHEVCQLMQNHPRIVEELYKSAFSDDTACTRFAMVALGKLLQGSSEGKIVFPGVDLENEQVRSLEMTKGFEDAPLCTKNQLDQVFEVAKNTSLSEVRIQCMKVINAAVNEHYRGKGCCVVWSFICCCCGC